MEENVERYDEYVAGMKSAEGSACIACPEGTLELSTFTKTIERGSVTLVIKDVPALVCDTCGDASYSEKVGRRLSEMADAAEAAGVETAVRSFKQAKAA